jgi:hypothetical protein
MFLCLLAFHVFSSVKCSNIFPLLKLNYLLRFFFVFVFLEVLGFELRALHLLGKHPTTLVMPCFCGYFLERVILFAQAVLDYNPTTVGFQLFSIEMGSCKLFCLGWS